MVVLQKILAYSFYLLFFLTPLIFTPLNNELFEYNKMFFVYFMTVIVVGTWLIKMVYDRTLICKRTPLDIPILLFLGSQILSTVFSIDPHTSIWGYYSRQNGGLLSLISYLLLYYAFVSNFKKEDVLKFLKVALFGGFLVSLYAIPEHFGVSPSCIILVKRFAADCWIQDVQARVFATLGQPNWLAAYLGMLIFPCIYFITQAKTLRSRATYYILLTTYYLAFTFTYSRGATLGVLGGLGILLLSVISYQFSDRSSSVFSQSVTCNIKKPLLLVTCLLLLINLLFGSALTGDFRFIKQAAPPPRPGISLAQASGGTQLENGGTESGQIRLIVWKGAFEIFKHYPILGSGLETFAYSYYNFRPKEHNFVSEWDFLYNKAHNEFLNYLATTGALGFGTYILMILIFIYWCMRYILLNHRKLPTTNYLLLTTSLLASYVSYLIQNFFLFSVVIIALLFYLIPGFVFVYTDSKKPLNLKLVNSFLSFLGKRFIFQSITIILIIFTCTSLILTLGKIWLGDTLYKNGADYSDLGNPGRAYNNLVSAVELNPGEPLYRNELGFAAASAAVALEEEDATTSASLKDEAINQTEKSLRMSPANLSLWRTAIRTFYQLTALDPKFNEVTLTTVDQAISLAPTDPKLYYNKGLILQQEGKSKEAVQELRKALELRPSYVEAIMTLAGAYEKLENFKNALIEYEKALKFVPNNEEIIKKVEELKNK